MEVQIIIAYLRKYNQKKYLWEKLIFNFDYFTNSLNWVAVSVQGHILSNAVTYRDLASVSDNTSFLKKI